MTQLRYPACYQVNTHVWLREISQKLGRAATLDELSGEELHRFYGRLLNVLHRQVVRDGQWKLLECAPAWEGNWTWGHFLAFACQGPEGERRLVTVNFASNRSQCYLRLPFPELLNRRWQLQDLLGGAVCRREGNDLYSRGFYLAASPWETSVFSVTESD
jgi:hypothetical protein